jgi:hypothetical protein
MDFHAKCYGRHGTGLMVAVKNKWSAGWIQV